MMTGTFSRTLRRHVAPLALVLALPLAGLAGCDALTDAQDAESVVGTWVRTDGSYTEYLEITSGTIAVYYSVTGICFDSELYSIEEKDGDRYALHNVLSSSSATFTITIRREGEELALTYEQETAVYRPAEQDVEQLEICIAGGGDDPAVDCSGLPAVTPGQSVSGELTTADALGDDGRYFDLYGLTLAAQATVVIEATSDPVDTYLYLYESDGTLIAENDDASDSTFDSRIQATLPAGCYRIEVTSYADGETGAYLLQVN